MVRKLLEQGVSVDCTHWVSANIPLDVFGEGYMLHVCVGCSGISGTSTIFL